MRDNDNKYENVRNKMLWIAEETSSISEDFILMNDNFFLFKKYDIIPYYYKGYLKEWYEDYPYKSPSNLYYKIIEETYKQFPEGYKIMSVNDIKKYKDYPFISINDAVGWSSQFQSFISARFLNPSRFEK